MTDSLIFLIFNFKYNIFSYHLNSLLSANEVMILVWFGNFPSWIIKEIFCSILYKVDSCLLGSVQCIWGFLLGYIKGGLFSFGNQARHQLKCDHECVSIHSLGSWVYIKSMYNSWSIKGGNFSWVRVIFKSDVGQRL